MYSKVRSRNRTARTPIAVAASWAVGVALLLGGAPAYAQEDVDDIGTALDTLPSTFSVNESNVESEAETLAEEEPIPIFTSNGQDTGIAIAAVDTGSVESIEPLGALRDSVSRIDDTSTVAQRKVDGSVQIVTVLESANAPTQYRYDISLPEGARLEVTETGSVIALGAQDEYLASVQEPWAVDADGNNIPTHFTVDGSSLVQVVEHGPDDSYPVVADPWLGVDLYYQPYVTPTSQGYIITVTPTQHGGSMSTPINSYMWWAHSDEVRNKLGGDSWRWNNNIQEQFYCHVAGYPVSANPEYDMESWHPFMSWGELTSRKCNSEYP